MAPICSEERNVKVILVGFAFLSLGFICVMQRQALYALKHENLIIRKYAAKTFIDAALEDVKVQNCVATANALSFLPEPQDYIAKDVVARIEMLQLHCQPSAEEYPALEWINAILAAARNEITHSRRTEPVANCPYGSSVSR